mgnify:CR=1 FL=1
MCVLGGNGALGILWDLSTELRAMPPIRSILKKQRREGPFLDLPFFCVFKLLEVQDLRAHGAMGGPFLNSGPHGEPACSPNVPSRPRSPRPNAALAILP